MWLLLNSLVWRQKTLDNSKFAWRWKFENNSSLKNIKTKYWKRVDIIKVKEKR